ncbi:hypothetical protein AMS68_005175 [Peltaster fructicola]|uniref:Uncharacterized protein n=1 Tax=Peltaster fructicola TaxID=286661 RepID=A0A6H0XYI6_9PEZI|nr:hypothetical protein AMS68_005175 [Peltaster fructicola]
MAPISSLHTSYTDSRIVESRQPLEAQTQPQWSALTPPHSPEELTLRILGVRHVVNPVSGEHATLASRQSQEGVYPIELQYQGLSGGLSPAAVVGITLGSVAGFLLLMWLLWTLSNGSTFIRTTGELEEVDTVRTRSRGKRARSRREMQSRSGSSPQRVYRSERIIRDFPPQSRSPSVMRDRDRSQAGGRTIIVEERTERRVEGDDIIEVMEEHSSVDAPRRKSRRQSDRSRY